MSAAAAITTNITSQLRTAFDKAMSGKDVSRVPRLDGVNLYAGPWEAGATAPIPLERAPELVANFRAWLAAFSSVRGAVVQDGHPQMWICVETGRVIWIIRAKFAPPIEEPRP